MNGSLFIWFQSDYIKNPRQAAPVNSHPACGIELVSLITGLIQTLLSAMSIHYMGNYLPLLRGIKYLCGNNLPMRHLWE